MIASRVFSVSQESGPGLSGRRLVQTGLALAALALLAACTAGPKGQPAKADDAAALESQPPTSQPPTSQPPTAEPADEFSEQRQSVHRFVACLRDMGLAAEAIEFDARGDRLTYMVDEEGRIVGGVDGTPDFLNTGYPRDSEPADAESTLNMEFDALLAQHGGEVLDERGRSVGPPLLLWEGQDRSEEFAACVAESGFEHPVVYSDPAVILKDSQHKVQMGVEWARCARDNGFPDVEDPAPVVSVPDDGVLEATPGEVIIPGAPDAAQLRALVEACPTFDLEAAQACEMARNDPGSGLDPDGGCSVWMQQVAVDVDTAAFGVDPSADGAANVEAWDRVDEMRDILYQAQTEFMESLEACH